MKFAIIGAGVTGLSLAQMLQSAGLTVTVFEKSRGRGGRASSKRLDWASCDLGAQYFTVRDEHFRLAVENWLKQGWITKWDFTPYRISDNQCLPSPDRTHRFVGIPTMNQFLKQMTKSIKVELNTEIAHLSKAQAQWQIWDNQQNLIGLYDWAISTVPAEQARAFFPSYPQLHNQIPEKVHTPCWAVALATKGHIAPKIQGVFGDRTISWLSRDSSKPNRESSTTDCDDVWVLHFSESWSQTHIELPEQEMVDLAFNWLADKLSAPELELRHSYRHFWRNARFDQNQPLRSDIICDLELKAAVLGDWCYGGRIENAYLAAHNFYQRYLG